MTADRRVPEPTSTTGAHTHGPSCAHCGHEMGVERSYDTNDRMMQMLLLALCREHGLQATRKGRKHSKLNVTAPDSATLDRFEARAQELMAKLDVELLAVTAKFLLEQTGVEFAAPGGK